MTEEGARLNFARGLDASSPNAGSARGGDGVIDVPSPQFGRGGQGPPPTIERDLFDRQTGSVAASLADQLADAAGADDPADIAAGGVQARPKKDRKRRDDISPSHARWKHRILFQLPTTKTD